ncbi:hypothetical protein [Proteus sp. G2609]|uniref:hypothetical protein n=1 Tax=Proteus sp. G2609 TaxID=2698840 RepID=UPI00137850FF|nr:hypothetical protein [Proteus sp. G2609]
MTIFRFDHPTRLTKGYNHESYGQLNLTLRDAMKRNECQSLADVNLDKARHKHTHSRPSQ